MALLLMVVILLGLPGSGPWPGRWEGGRRRKLRSKRGGETRTATVFPPALCVDLRQDWRCHRPHHHRQPLRSMVLPPRVNNSTVMVSVVYLEEMSRPRRPPLPTFPPFPPLLRVKPESRQTGTAGEEGGEAFWACWRPRLPRRRLHHPRRLWQRRITLGGRDSERLFLLRPLQHPNQRSHQ